MKKLLTIGVTLLTLGTMMSTAEAANRSEVKAAQKALNWLGYGAGKVDGAIGQGTRQAIRRFQADYGYRIDRKIHSDQLKVMEYEAGRVNLFEAMQSIPPSLYYATGSRQGAGLFPTCRMSRRGPINPRSNYRQSGECGFVNALGEWVVSPAYAAGYTQNLSYSIALRTPVPKSEAQEDRRFNHKGEKLGSDVKRIETSWFDPHDVATAVNGKKGILNRTGDGFKIQPIYDAVHVMGRNYFAGVRNGKTTIFRLFESQIAFSGLGKFSQLYKLDGDWFLTSDGANVTMTDFKSRNQVLYKGATGISASCPGYFVVNLGSRSYDKYALIDHKGKEIYRTTTGSIRVERGLKCPAHFVMRGNDGHSSKIVALKSGKVVHESQYALEPLDAYFQAYNKSKKRWGLIDIKGNVVVDFNEGYFDYREGYLLFVRPFDRSFLQKIIPDASKPNGYRRETIASNLKGGSGELVSNLNGVIMARLSYGNAFHGVGGDYLVDMKGAMHPKSASRELALFIDACEKSKGKSNKEINPLKASCHDYYRAQARTGDAQAAFSLAFSYLILGDAKAGVEWLKRAAERGSVEAQSALAEDYSTGFAQGGLPKDLNQTARWFQLAAANGHVHSQFAMGEMHVTGKYGRKDIPTAYYWYKKAAANGHELAAKQVRNIERHLASRRTQRQRANSMTLGDVFRKFNRYMPSQAEVNRQRTYNNCKKQQQKCYATCANYSPLSGGTFKYSPRQKCKAQCYKIKCN